MYAGGPVGLSLGFNSVMEIRNTDLVKNIKIFGQNQVANLQIEIIAPLHRSVSTLNNLFWYFNTGMIY